MRAPWAGATKNGSPPTAPNARTGELTPPGIRFCARANQSSLMRRSRERFGEFACEVGEDHVGAGPLDREQVLQRDRFAVDPAELSRGLHHRVLAADVVRGDGDVERGAYLG